MATALNPNDQILLTGRSMASSFTSPWIPIYKNIVFAFQAIWTGAPVGNFGLQFSCDSVANTAVTPTNVIPYAASLSAAGGAAGSLIITYEPTQVAVNWVQFFYTSTSGTGLLTSLTFNGR